MVLPIDDFHWNIPYSIKVYGLITNIHEYKLGWVLNKELNFQVEALNGAKLKENLKRIDKDQIFIGKSQKFKTLLEKKSQIPLEQDQIPS